MKYYRSDSIFPPELLREMRQYITEGIVYFPKPKGERLSWGEASGERERLTVRNSEIKSLYQTKRMTHEELAERYHLSVETIRNIIYRK
jgi:Mor family transcriptional regulator